jgi:hypothetical protein
MLIAGTFLLFREIDLYYSRKKSLLLTHDSKFCNLIASSTHCASPLTCELSNLCLLSSFFSSCYSLCWLVILRHGSCGMLIVQYTIQTWDTLKVIFLFLWSCQFRSFASHFWALTIRKHQFWLIPDIVCAVSLWQVKPALQIVVFKGMHNA